MGTEKAWKYLQERNMPRAIYIAKTDEENGDFNGAWQTLREKFGRSVCPVMMPLWDEEKHIETLLDIVYRRAYQLEGKRRKEVPIPADKQDVVDELYDQLCESVAETSEEFMEKYFSGEPFTQEEGHSGPAQRRQGSDTVPCGVRFGVHGPGNPDAAGLHHQAVPQPCGDPQPQGYGYARQ